MIPQTAEYALRAVIFLLEHGPQPIQGAEIATQTQVPLDYLHKICKELIRAGLIATQRGPGGGYWLRMDPERITVWDVYSAVAEVPRIKQCPLGIEAHERLCPLHRLLDDQARQFEEALKTTRLLDLLPRKGDALECRFPPSFNPLP